MNANKKDSKIWNGIRKGNKQSLSQLYFLYQETLFTYGCAIINNRELVKDCLQELFLDIWNRKNRMPQVIHVKSYLLKAFRRILIRKIKKESPEIYSGYFEFVEFEESPEELIIKNEYDQSLCSYISKKLAQLPPRQKEIIYLRYYQDLGYDKISEIMGLKPQAAWNLFSRALNKLKQLVKDQSYLISILSLVIINFL